MRPALTLATAAAIGLAMVSAACRRRSHPCRQCRARVVLVHACEYRQGDRHLRQARPRSRNRRFRRRRQAAASHGGRRGRYRTRLRTRHGFHCQRLAGQRHRSHGGTAADLRARGARRRFDKNHRRPQRPQGRHFDCRLGNELADERGLAAAWLGLRRLHPDSDRRKRRAHRGIEVRRSRCLRGRDRVRAQFRSSVATAAS